VLFWAKSIPVFVLSSKKFIFAGKAVAQVAHMPENQTTE
jgi:hypothetical protein